MERRQLQGVKPTNTEAPKKDKKDVVIGKYVEEHKILKLIDRMCNGESLNHDQFVTVFDYVKKKGHSSVIQEEWMIPVWDGDSIAYHRKEIRERPGYRYLGIFATMEGNEMVLKYGDTRNSCIASRTCYKTGKIIEH